MGYFIFLFIIGCLFILGEYTRRKGFHSLVVRREADKLGVFEGEEITITTIIENNKWLPISFLLVREKMPINIEYFSDGNFFYSGEYSYHKSQYSVLWYERKKRAYKIRINKRGAYSLRTLSVSIGDYFGFSTETAEVEDYLELLIYPSAVDINRFHFESTNLQGEDIVRRWIHKDPLYVKGIREYSVEDRMKDIHWKSSLKMNKLMVKDYDYTSDREIVVIENVQCGENHWNSIDEQAIEKGIQIGVSIVEKAIEQGIPAGMWTNAQIISYYKEPSCEVQPTLNSVKNIMELCARIDASIRIELDPYLNLKGRDFRHNCTYILITPFLSEETCNILSKLRRAGFLIKIIDVCSRGEIPSIEGIEKVKYGGERKE